MHPGDTPPLQLMYAIVNSLTASSTVQTAVLSGPHINCYSVISRMLRYVFALSHNAQTLMGSVIASIIYALGILVPLSLLIVIALSL
jgi:hypothetical protein